MTKTKRPKIAERTAIAYHEAAHCVACAIYGFDQAQITAIYDHPRRHVSGRCYDLFSVCGPLDAERSQTTSACVCPA